MWGRSARESQPRVQPLTRRAFHAPTLPAWSLIPCILAGTTALLLGLTGESERLGRSLAAGLAIASWVFGLVAVFRGFSRPFALPLGYLALLGVFHLPTIPLDMAGFESEFSSRWIRSEWLVPAMCLVAVACAALVTGVEVAHRWQSIGPRSIADSMPTHEQRDSNVVLWETGLALWLLSLVLLAIGAFQLNLFSGRYIDYWENSVTADTRLFITGLQFVMIASVITSTGAASRFIPYCIAGFFACSLPLALFGFRGPVIVYLIAMLPTWFRKRPRLTRRLAVAAGVAVVLVSPIIAVVRTGEEVSDGITSRASPVAFLLETGNTMMPLVETVRLLDTNQTRHWYGESYAEAATRVLPNLGVQKRAASADERAPAQWLVGSVAPWAVGLGSGFGFSGVAEPYLNFGIVGVLLYFFCLGYVLEVADRWLGRNPFVASGILSTYGSLLWTIRNDYCNFTRPAVWSLVIVVAAYLIDNHLVRTRRSPGQVHAVTRSRRWGAKT